jgi:hypothetical protein
MSEAKPFCISKWEVWEAYIRRPIEPFRAAQLAWMRIPGIDE